MIVLAIEFSYFEPLKSDNSCNRFHVHNKKSWPQNELSNIQIPDSKLLIFLVLPTHLTLEVLSTNRNMCFLTSIIRKKVSHISIQ